jgi:hypothetical protein
MLSKAILFIANGLLQKQRLLLQNFLMTNATLHLFSHQKTQLKSKITSFSTIQK